MTVYVDDMRTRCGALVMCHMIADSDDELHAMADRIGVDRKWWQSPETTSGSHYDIAQTKRVLAIHAGAVQITRRQCAAMNLRRRVTGELGRPDDSVSWFMAHSRAHGEGWREAQRP